MRPFERVILRAMLYAWVIGGAIGVPVMILGLL
jgi:hypothetical protein